MDEMSIFLVKNIIGSRKLSTLTKIHEHYRRKQKFMHIRHWRTGFINLRDRIYKSKRQIENTNLACGR